MRYLIVENKDGTFSVERWERGAKVRELFRRPNAQRRNPWGKPAGPTGARRVAEILVRELNKVAKDSEVEYREDFRRAA